MSQSRISQFFVLSSRGDRILTRDYRHDIVENSEMIFFREVKSLERQQTLEEPIFVSKSILWECIGLNINLITVCIVFWWH